MFAIIATVLSGVCMVVTAVATAIPYWVHASVAGVTVNIGLWKLCGSKPGFSSQCTDWPEDYGWLQGVRAFEILGILASAAALGLGILYLIKRDNYMILRFAYICSFVSGAFTIIGAIIWATKWDDAIPLSESKLSLYAGFGVAIAAGIGAKIAGWCYVIGARQQIIQPGTIINKY